MAKAAQQHVTPTGLKEVVCLTLVMGVCERSLHWQTHGGSCLAAVWFGGFLQMNYGHTRLQFLTVSLIQFVLLL